MSPLAMNLMLALLCGTSLAYRSRSPSHGSTAPLTQVDNKAYATLQMPKCCCMKGKCTKKAGDQTFKLDLLEPESLQRDVVEYCCKVKTKCDSVFTILAKTKYGEDEVLAQYGGLFGLRKYTIPLAKLPEAAKRFDASSCKELPASQPEPPAPQDAASEPQTSKKVGGASQPEPPAPQDAASEPQTSKKVVVDISQMFGNKKVKKFGDTSYYCCCQGHHDEKYVSCELVPAVTSFAIRGGCGGLKGDTWHSFTSFHTVRAIKKKYIDYESSGKCVVPFDDAVPAMKSMGYHLKDNWEDVLSSA